jgi:hypothetical protein
MTQLIRDLKYEEAKAIVDSLDPANERDALIKYYVEKHEQWYNEQRRVLDEYTDVFQRMNNLLRRSY